MTRLRILLLRDRAQELRDRERLQLGVGLDQNRAVGAERERGPQRLLAGLHAAGRRDDLRRGARFLQPHRLFDRDLVEGIHGHLDVGGLDARAVRLHAHLDVEIDHALDRHQDFH